MRAHINEAHFALELRRKAKELSPELKPDFVTGPGRSGALAAVYYSHLTGVPFIPWGYVPDDGWVMVIDTATMSGRTMRKACNKLNRLGVNVVSLAVFETPGVHNVFWYEADYDAGQAHDNLREYVGAI